MSSAKLEELSLSMRCDNPFRISLTPLSDALFSDGAPKLTKLRLSNVRMLPSPAIAAQLRWLQIKVDLEISPDFLVSAVASCHALEYLAISADRFTLGIDQLPATAHEPKLRHLELVTKARIAKKGEPILDDGYLFGLGENPGPLSPLLRKLDTSTVPTIILGTGWETDVLDMLADMIGIHTVVSSSSCEVRATDSRDTFCTNGMQHARSSQIANPLYSLCTNTPSDRTSHGRNQPSLLLRMDLELSR